MTDKKSNDSRRKLLKSIAAGSGAVVAGKTLPEAWTKPVVDSVLLPAHAATTDEEGPCCLTAGCYGGEMNDGEIVYIELTVTTDGSISFSLFSKGESVPQGTATVECTGGEFSTTVEPGFDVTGTVACGQTTITGTVVGETPQTYTATLGGCES